MGWECLSNRIYGMAWARGIQAIKHRNRTSTDVPWSKVILRTHITYIHTCMHTYIHTYIHTSIHTYIHIYIKYTYIHFTHVYIYIHNIQLIYIYIYVCVYSYGLILGNSHQCNRNLLPQRFGWPHPIPFIPMALMSDIGWHREVSSDGSVKKYGPPGNGLSSCLIKIASLG